MSRWALVLAGMVIVRRNWDSDKCELERTFAAMKKRRWPVCTSFRRTPIMPRVGHVPGRHEAQSKDVGEGSFDR